MGYVLALFGFTAVAYVVKVGYESVKELNDFSELGKGTM